MIERQGSTNAGPPEPTQTDFLLNRNPPPLFCLRKRKKIARKRYMRPRKIGIKYIAFSSVDVVKLFCIKQENTNLWNPGNRKIWAKLVWVLAFDCGWVLLTLGV